jgi:hypothetical protein
MQNTYENSNISPCKKYNLPKDPLKETKVLQDTYYNSIYNNSSQVSTQAKISSFKNLHIKNKPIIIT